MFLKMNQQPLVTPSPFAVSAAPLGTAPSPFLQQQQQQPFGGGFGGATFGFSSGNLFGSTSAASGPFTAAGASGQGAPAASATPEDSTPMAVQKETKNENYTEGKIYLEAWKHLMTAKKSGCWPFTSIGAGPASEPVFEGFVLTPDELHWEFMKRNQQEQNIFLQQLNDRLYTVQREFCLKVKEKTAAERLPFEIDLLYKTVPSVSPSAFPGASVCALAAPNNSRNSQVSQQLQTVFGSAAHAVSVPVSVGNNTDNSLETAAAATATHAREEALDAFRSAAFQPGNIPDLPPPPELCN